MRVTMRTRPGMGGMLDSASLLVCKLCFGIARGCTLFLPQCPDVPQYVPTNICKGGKRQRLLKEG